MNGERPRSDEETYLAATSGLPLGERFTPGTLVGGRFRIVAPLGRGGMGEVYRADDTKLGHAVALKFLPRRGIVDSATLDRLRAEVRLGRQVSHPSVCRIYDIGESSDGPFIAMEYVDGEDLASLLRRIGRLPSDKALEIARDLSAGLAAAHDLGILHRDLKPANVMIDGRGRPRITDFGLAALAAELEAGGGFSGTPVYMAPEQLEGGRVTARTDIYALGLILYEVFTGKRLFDGRSIDEIRTQHRAHRPRSLSTAVREIDPAIERIIVRCLDEDPAARPSSAHAVIASLPGGDPLDAAVAAGETPSPGMVAAAGQTGELRPAVAWPLVIAAVAAIVLVAVMASRSTVVGLVPLPKSPDVLDARAQEIAERLGYSDRASAAHEWIVENDYARYVIGQNPSRDRWRAAGRTIPSLLHFIYRSSTRPMIAWKADWRIDTNDPPFVQPGMTRIGLDPLGRLISFEAIPPQKEDAVTAATADWHLLFREASLDPLLFHEVQPMWSAPADVDEKKAWEGTLAEQPDIALHLEAGAHRGRINWFKVFGPWDAPVPLHEPATPAVLRTSIILRTLIPGLVLIPALVMAVRNFRRGRCDRRGASRLALVITAMTAVATVIRADHAATLEEWPVMQGILAWTIWTGTFTWLVYMALEPYVRRKVPHTLIAWNRLLAGRVRDPMVGRDVLIGALAGAGLFSATLLQGILPPWFGAPVPAPLEGNTSSLASARHVAFYLIDNVRYFTSWNLELMFMFVVFFALFRRYWLAVALTSLVFVTVFQPVPLPGAPRSLVLAASGLGVALILYILLRWGLLAAGAMGVVFGWLSASPLTLDTTSWYAGRSYFVLAVCSTLAIYGFVVSLGGRPMFGRPLFEE